MDLPDISQAFDANTAEYVAALSEAIDTVKAFAAANRDAVASVAELQSAINALDGKTIHIEVVTTGVGDVPGATAGTGAAASAAASEAAAAASDEAAAAAAKQAAGNEAVSATAGEAAGSEAKMAAASTASAAAAKADASAADSAAAGAAEQAAAYKMVTDAISDEAKALAALAVASRLEAENAAGMQLAADALKALTGDGQTASDSLRGIIAAMQGANTPTRVFGLSLTQLHWILGVSFETLAVTIPAIIAFGAGMDVAAQGANNMYNHVVALWQACESMGGAFNATMGSVFGLKTVLQQAQNEANPGVYELLGSVINDCKEQFGDLASTGLDVVHMLDEFAARITVDLRGSQGEVTALLGNMESDLQEIGQVFGNLGHAVLNFAADMPGLAEVLLKIVDAISQVILWISELPPWLITVAMGFEEFYRWGGLVASLIARIGLLLPLIGPGAIGAVAGVFSRLAAIMGSVVGVGAQLVSGLGVVAGTVGGVFASSAAEGEAAATAFAGSMGIVASNSEMLVEDAGGAEKALGGLAERMAVLASNTALMGGIGIAVAALVGLAVAFDHVRNSSQQYIASINKAVAASSDLTVINTLANSLVGVSQKISQQESVLQGYPLIVRAAGSAVGNLVTSLEHTSGPIGGATQGLMNLTTGTGNWGKVTQEVVAVGTFGLGNVFTTLIGGSSEAASQVDQLNAEQQKLVGTFKTVDSNLGYLTSTYHLSGEAAQELAQEAGVNLQKAMTGSSQAAEIARQQIANFVTGLSAMSAPVGTLGNDMEALGIQSQLADTKVSQLNSAWDAFISSVTAGMSSFSQIQSALQGMAADSAVASHSLSGAAGSISASGTAITYSLKGLGSTAMQSWQQFTSAIGTGEQALDFLRTGMAEGVVSSSQFTSSVKALVGEFVPFTDGSKTAVSMLSALAQEAGGPATTSQQTLAHWAGVTGNTAATQLANGIETATQKMSNMSTVAQNLASVVSSDLDAALAANITKDSGVSAAVEKYTQDLSNAHTPATTLKQDVDNISAAMQKENTMAATAAQGVNAAGNAATAAGGHTASAGNQIQGAGNQILTAAGKADALRNSLLNIPTHITTNVVTVFSTVGTPYTAAGAAANAILHPAAHGGMVTPLGIIPSFAGGGAIPGYAPGQDSVIAAVSPGEGVLTPQALRAIGGAPMLNWLNSTAGQGGGSGGGGVSRASSGTTGDEMVNHVHVYLDGKELFTSIQRQTLSYNTRNSGRRTGTMAPG